MSGSKASTSRSNSIWVKDFLDRYEADALRYYLTAAGPETQDSDFTWEEFVRRTNDELLANWGNLVNRTLVNAHRNFGAVPEPGELTEGDEALLAAVERAFETVGEHIENARFRAALAEAMATSALANQYLADQAPWTVVKTDRDRAATVLYVALRVVDSLKTLFLPFLPFSSQALHELLGYDGWIAGPLEIRTVEEEGGATHNILTGDYTSWVGAWAPSELPAGPGAPRAAAALPQARRGGSARGRSSVIDTHAHLAALEDPDAVVERAAAAGVTRILTVGTDVEDCRRQPPSRRGARRRLRDPRDPSARRGRHDRRGRRASARAARAPEGGRRRGDGPRLVPRLRAARRAAAPLRAAARARG